MSATILFVDDEEQVLDAMRRLLHGRADGWDLLFARTADEALEATWEADLDVVVSDIGMPGRDGFQLLTALKALDRTRDVPVIILTGRGQNDLKRRALDLGAMDLLNKPVEREDLVARIQSALTLKRYQDELKVMNERLEQAVRERTLQLERSRVDILWRLSKAGEYRDEETGSHVCRVGWYCRILAEALGQPSEFVEQIFLASPLHDIGKIGTPDHILLKRDSLTPYEWDIMKRHSQIGSEILLSEPRQLAHFLLRWRSPAAAVPVGDRDNALIQMAASIALAHHERWDGTGYPAGLRAEAIPIEARIAALADSYDALSSERPYKMPFPEEQVAHVIRSEAGSHFDPRVVLAFDASRDAFRSVRAEFAEEAVPPQFAEVGP